MATALEPINQYFFYIQAEIIRDLKHSSFPFGFPFTLAHHFIKCYKLERLYFLSFSLLHIFAITNNVHYITFRIHTYMFVCSVCIFVQLNFSYETIALKAFHHPGHTPIFARMVSHNGNMCACLPEFVFV